VTYIVIGYNGEFKSKEECENAITYIKTKFFRYLVLIKKKTQNVTRELFQFVPLQDFSKPWTDEELYKLFDVKPTEIEYINTMIRPMD
jgi:site-specific DNA-methyltransferase (adenine-specific)